VGAQRAGNTIEILQLHAIDNGTVVVTVPVYKASPSKEEKASLLQLFSILGDFPIRLFTFKELDLKEYSKILKDYSYDVTYFNKIYFKDISGYNALLLNPKFYATFKSFKYLLIYQLDSWVFKNDLQQWCDRDYDYIGAPWFSSDDPEEGLSHFLGVGNGGFSLRKIKSHLTILSGFSYIKSPAYLIGVLFNKLSFKNVLTLFANLTVNNNTYFLLGKNGLPEDNFWHTIIRKEDNVFTAPDMLIASQFSAESNAEKLYQLNNNKLPFGCHAWEKYDVAFWKNHIVIAPDLNG